ncbi:unnamed protein product [Anisakis simplex]|uniref:Uncharacterized protein n=1 Tax=Anisakis simplex TaxID=6269 RepID=A0A0M3JRV6_ANISI|nr:unnamed protein product [Anisakis simplex]
MWSSSSSSLTTEVDMGTSVAPTSPSSSPATNTTTIATTPIALTTKQRNFELSAKSECYDQTEPTSASLSRHQHHYAATFDTTNTPGTSDEQLDLSCSSRNKRTSSSRSKFSITDILNANNDSESKRRRLSTPPSELIRTGATSNVAVSSEPTSPSLQSFSDLIDSRFALPQYVQFLHGGLASGRQNLPSSWLPMWFSAFYPSLTQFPFPAVATKSPRILSNSEAGKSP